MKKYIFKRLLHLLWIMFAVSFFTFMLIYFSPGDAATKKLYSHGVAVTEEVLQKTREEMGLVRPFIVQYGDWASQALKGDLGVSFKDGMSVTGKMIKGMRHTFILTAASLFLSLAVSLPLSIFTAIKKDSIPDYIIRFLSFVGNSLPNFLIAVLLMYFLCVKAKLLPIIADGTFKGLILPCLALSIPLCGRFLRQFRAEILEQLSCEYVSGAASRGVKSYYILFKNVLHNASIPILTIAGLSVGTLLGGSVVIETIFRWPGMGKLAMDAITNRDYPVIQAFVLFTTTIYVVINLATDVCYHLIDPRVRQD